MNLEDVMDVRAAVETYLMTNRVLDHRKLHAVKRVRELTCCGLADAKFWVEKHMEEFSKRNNA